VGPSKPPGGGLVPVGSDAFPAGGRLRAGGKVPEESSRQQCRRDNEGGGLKARRPNVQGAEIAWDFVDGEGVSGTPPMTRDLLCRVRVRRQTG